MEMKFVALGIILTIILLFAITLFLFNLQSGRGGILSLIDKVSSSFGRLFSCFPIQSQSCFCGAYSQPCCDKEPKCSAGLQCGAKNNCACPGGQSFDEVTKSCK